ILLFATVNSPTSSIVKRLPLGLLVTSYTKRTANRSSCGYGPETSALCTMWLSRHHLLLARIASSPLAVRSCPGGAPASTLTTSFAKSSSRMTSFFPSWQSATYFFPISKVDDMFPPCCGVSVLRHLARAKAARRGTFGSRRESRRAANRRGVRGTEGRPP